MEAIFGAKTREAIAKDVRRLCEEVLLMKIDEDVCGWNDEAVAVSFEEKAGEKSHGNVGKGADQPVL